MRNLGFVGFWEGRIRLQGSKFHKNIKKSWQNEWFIRVILLQKLTIKHIFLKYNLNQEQQIKASGWYYHINISLYVTNCYVGSLIVEKICEEQ